MTDRVLIVDGNSLCHRAFHGMMNGEPSGAYVAGTVAAAVGSAWSAHGPYAAVVFCFDSPNNRRKELYPFYKEGRSESPDELYEQMDLAKQLFGDGGLTVAEVDGWEADDLLACGAAESHGVGAAAHLLTSDRDMIALVDEDTTMLRIVQSIHESVAYTPDVVADEYGVEPWQYVLLAAFRGDPSDGIDGVDGIGPKTAVKLLADHGDVDGIYAALDTMSPSLRTRLEDGRARLDRNVALMSPNLDLHVGVADAVDAGVSADRLRHVLDAADAGSGGSRLHRALLTTVDPDLQPSMF